MEFVGRELELQALMQAWTKTKQNDPQLVVLLADSGYGKTRLVHEFYHKISTSNDPADYWPDYLGSNASYSGDTSLNVNPTFSTDTVTTSAIPWLWWGLRWKQPDRNHINLSINSEVDQLLPHFDPIVKAHNDQQLIKNVFMNVGEALVGLAGGDILANLVATGGLIKDIIDNRKDQPSQLSISERQEEERQSMIDKLLEFFRVVLNDKDNIMPVILFLDDAQWMDDTGREFIDRLLTEATNKNWPLMIITTHWEREWFLAENDQDSFSGLITTLRTSNLSQNWQPLRIGKLTETLTLLTNAFPGLTEKGKQKIESKVDGNPLYLEQIILELKYDEEYFEEGDLNNPLSEYGHEELAEILQTDLYGLFRKRFRKLNRNQRYLLSLGSIQGLTFFDEVIVKAACNGEKQKEIGKESDAINLLWLAASPESITAKSHRTTLSEFWHKLFYDLARDSLKNEEEVIPELIKASLDWYEHKEEQEERLKTSDLSFLRLWVINQIEQNDISFLSNKQLTNLATVYAHEAFFAEENNKYYEAEHLYKQSLNYNKKCFGDEHCAVATSMFWLARFYHNTSYCEDEMKVEKLYQDSLLMRRELLGHENLSVSTSLYWLGCFYKYIGWFEKAKPMVKESLAIRKKLLGEHLFVVNCLNSLAHIYQQIGDYSATERTMIEELTLRKIIQGDSHDDVIETFERLEYFYETQGNYAADLRVKEDRFRSIKKSYGEESIYEIQILGEMADLEVNQRHYTRAEILYKECLAMRIRRREKHVKVEQTNTKIHCYHLKRKIAGIYYIQKDYIRVVPLFEENIVLGKELNMNCQNTQENLANIYSDMGAYTKAEPLYLEILENLNDSYLSNRLWYRLEIAIFMNRLAAFYWKMKEHEKSDYFLKESLELRSKLLVEDEQRNLKWSEVETLEWNEHKKLYEEKYLSIPQDECSSLSCYLRESLRLQEMLLGEGHPDFWIIHDDLAEVYLRTGDYASAEPLFQKSLERRRELYEEDHPDVEDCFDSLISLYKSQKCSDQVEQMYLDRLAIQRRSDKNSKVITSLVQLASFYELDRRYDEAESLYLESLATHKRLGNDEDPDMSDTLNDLAKFYEQVGRYEEAKDIYKKCLYIRQNHFGVDDNRTKNCEKSLCEIWEKINKL